jgi:hypothetical protein
MPLLRLALLALLALSVGQAAITDENQAVVTAAWNQVSERWVERARPAIFLARATVAGLLRRRVCAPSAAKQGL